MIYLSLRYRPSTLKPSEILACYLVRLVYILCYVLGRSHSTPSSGTTTPRYDYHDDTGYSKRMLDPIEGIAHLSQSKLNLSQIK